MRILLKILKSLKEYFGLYAFAIISITLIGTLYFYNIGGLTSGLSSDEYAVQQTVARNGIGLESIVRDPVFLPHAIALYVLQLTPFGGPAAVRGVGALFAIVGIAGFFLILNRWYTRRVAILGTLLFATSSCMLFTARFASEQSAYLLLPAFVALAILLRENVRSKLLIAATVLSTLGLLYVPGLMWFILPALIVERRAIKKILMVQPTWFTVTICASIVLLSIPLLSSIAYPAGRWHDSLQALIGIPQSLPSISAFWTTLWQSLSGVFVYSFDGPLKTVGHLPWLDVSTVGLCLIGIIQFMRHRKLNRTKVLGIMMASGIILSTISPLISISIILPLIYLFVAEGIRWLLAVWMKVFPKNPFARGFAVVLMTGVVLSITAYQLNKYFIAWPSAPETSAVYTYQP